MPVRLAQHTCAKGELTRFRRKGFLHDAAFGQRMGNSGSHGVAASGSLGGTLRWNAPYD
ncbi:hypothetical protein [Streptomyces sp. NBC_00620]|uniref:hypothetical protein n=1 Tax=Streptomyces sp. NBC_00620 TaxID=2903666 RepID=UPI00224DECB7|nr:hypothetical protein [Streptomyces sp. NBC_00620]MCX4978090.1 hypothetical protein [Streptomyces sp. NBC_00620]